MQVRRNLNRATRRTSNTTTVDDNECYMCNVNFYRESRANKDK